MKIKVKGPLCESRLPPTFAAGLLLAALLNIVGYRVFRQWVFHGQEALLMRADDLSWLVNWDLIAVFAYRAQARTHLTKPASSLLCPTMGSNTCVSIKISNCLPSEDLDSTDDRLLVPRSPFAGTCVLSTSKPAQNDGPTNRSAKLRTRALSESRLI
jgi:hypothetical protein